MTRSTDDVGRIAALTSSQESGARPAHAAEPDMPSSARVFLDTEFTNLASDARLISIGAVSIEGKEFYAELADGWAKSDCSEFVRKIVLPRLEIPVSERLSRAQCAEQLVRWLLDMGAGCSVVVVTVDSCIDWWMLGLLLDGQGWTTEQKEKFVGTQGLRVSLRPQIPHWDDAERMVRFRRMLKRSLKRLRRHHALNDARALRAAWMAA